MEFFHIALLQIAPCDGLAENLEKGIRFCKQAKAMGRISPCFRRCGATDTAFYNRPVAQWAAEAVPAEGGFVGAFQSLAKELNMAVGITLLEQYEPAPRNTLILFDRFGKRAFTYAKVHTCDFDVERNLTPGEDFLCRLLGHGPGRNQGGRHDLLRPGIPGERQNFDAEGRGADFGSQRLPHGDQPPFPASRQSL